MVTPTRRTRKVWTMDQILLVAQAAYELWLEMP